MNRRTLLGLLGTLATVGCLSDHSGVDPPIDVKCPTLSADADSLCAHTDDPSLGLRPSTWRLADGANVSAAFTLSNGTGETVDFAEFPSLKRRTKDGWKHVWPMMRPPMDRRLEPGASFSWEFTFYKEGTEHDADERVELYELESGTYAAVVGANLGDRSVQCVAPFEVGDSEGE